MAAQKYLNNFDWQIIGPVVASTHVGFENTIGKGILQISDACGALLGSLTGGDWYVLTLLKRSGSVESNYEIVKVLGVNEVAYAAPGECRIRVERGHEGTTPQTYVAGDLVSMRLTAGGADALLQAQDIAGLVTGPGSAVSGNLAIFSGTSGKVLADSGKAVPSGAIVGSSDSQTLSNKTLSAPVVSGGISVTSGLVAYGAGAGGTATQPTDKNQTVTLNKPSGRITTAASGNSGLFRLNNSFITAGSVVVANPVAFTRYLVRTYEVETGYCYIEIVNVVGFDRNEAVQINFSVQGIATS